MKRAPMSKLVATAWGTAIVLALYLPHLAACAGPHMSGCSSCLERWFDRFVFLPGLLIDLVMRAVLARVLSVAHFENWGEGASLACAAVGILAYLGAAIWFATLDRRFAMATVVATLVLASLNAFFLAKIFAM